MVKTFIPLSQAAAISGIVIRELLHSGNKAYAVLEKLDGSVTMCEAIAHGAEIRIDSAVIKADIPYADVPQGMRLRLYSQR